MRKQWFGDSRDYVKWSCVLREAGEDFTVIYAVMLRPDSFNDVSLDSAVVKFFDQQKRFNALETLFPGRFEVMDDLYEKKHAEAYFARLRALISAKKFGNILVFLDPDTGIEPLHSPKNEHLQIRDIESICRVLHPGDKVVVYQHASRSANWIEAISLRLKKVADDTNTELGTPFYSPGVAKDVCFFTLTKNVEQISTSATRSAPTRTAALAHVTIT
jgi:hypothetical protein